MSKKYIIKDSKGRDRIYTDVDNVTLTDIDGNEVVFTQQNVYNASNAYLVKVVDYDGTVLKSEKLNSGEYFELPEIPYHERLVFQEWSSPLDIVDNRVLVQNCDITIGAVYGTMSGLSEFDAVLTIETGLTVTLNMDGTKDWGDGTSDASTSHTYGKYGNYTITCDGSAITSTSSSGIFGQSSMALREYVKDIRLGNNVQSITPYAFQYCYSLQSITIPNTTIEVGTNVFQYCRGLVCVVFPSSVTAITNYVVQYCGSLKTVVIHKSVKSMYNSAFYNCYCLENVNFPDEVNYTGANLFMNCYNISSVVFGEKVPTIPEQTFQACYSLCSVFIPESIETIGANAFSGCYRLTNLIIKEGVTFIGQYAFRDCISLRTVKLPSTVTTIQNNAFTSCFTILKYDFSDFNAIPSLGGSGVFTNINKQCKIYVPDHLYDEWSTATNWVNYSDNIYRASEMPEG